MEEEDEKGEREIRKEKRKRSLHPNNPSLTHRELKITFWLAGWLAADSLSLILSILSVTWLKLTRNKPPPPLTTPLM